ncbi:hypothetical protein [Kaarinaea lacus]
MNEHWQATTHALTDRANVIRCINSIGREIVLAELAMEKTGKQTAKLATRGDQEF